MTSKNGKSNSRLEEGQSHCGWTLTKIEHADPCAQIGGYWFTLQRGVDDLKVSNRFWSSDRMMCTVNWKPQECPKELRIFGDRHVKIEVVDGIPAVLVPLQE